MIIQISSPTHCLVVDQVPDLPGRADYATTEWLEHLDNGSSFAAMTFGDTYEDAVQGYRHVVECIKSWDIGLFVVALVDAQDNLITRQTIRGTKETNTQEVCPCLK